VNRNTSQKLAKLWFLSTYYLLFKGGDIEMVKSGSTGTGEKDPKEKETQTPKPKPKPK